MLVTIYCEIETEDKLLEVELECDMLLQNNGIGAYEYWGYRGYDRGQDYWECDGPIEWNKKAYTEQENKAIEEYIQENEGKLQEEFEERAEKYD